MKRSRKRIPHFLQVSSLLYMLPVAYSFLQSQVSPINDNDTSIQETLGQSTNTQNQVGLNSSSSSVQESEHFSCTQKQAERDSSSTSVQEPGHCTRTHEQDECKCDTSSDSTQDPEEYPPLVDSISQVLQFPLTQDDNG